MEILGGILFFSSPHWFYPADLLEERGKEDHKTVSQNSLLQPTERPL